MSDIRSTESLRSLLAMLQWQVDLGVDETIAPAAQDWRIAWAAADTDRAGQMTADTDTVRTVSRRAPPVVAVVPDRPAATPLLAEPVAQVTPDLRAVDTLAALAESLRTFDGCTLKYSATNLVFADGNPNSGVMLIGEAPGEDEDRQGRPFVGPSGRLLDRMLTGIGLDRATVYITNILPWRPPGNRSPTQAEISACLPFLERHITLVAPRLIVSLGGTAAKTLLGRHEGVTRLRGRHYEYSLQGDARTVPVLVTFHPAYLLRSPARKRDAWLDMILLKRLLSERLP